MNLKNFTLELSAKPFYDTSEETAIKIVNNMFSQWDYICRQAEKLSVLLFLADGSEIFEWTGDLDKSFEWAYWLGVANPMPLTDNKSERALRNTHRFPKKYIENVASRPYSWVKTVVHTVKRIGKERYGKNIEVGYLYDNGPEFAISDFKFGRHKEIAQGSSLYPNSFVVCTAKLNEDKQPYAGFPNGIKQDTTIGTFLGRQFSHFAKTMGLDFLWLSNGMGFGTETWNICGMLFDNKKFYPEKVSEAQNLMLDFWHDLIKEMGDIPIRTRGTNFSAGVEISTDAAPLKEIYNYKNVNAPVNSPWAALNYNVGLEISAWMSHIACLPNNTITYRFYINDPWFMNSPWIDRYEKEPWDIYLPMSVSRINEYGAIEIPNSFNLLSVDDSWGNMPEEIPLEVTPHVKRAFDEASDDFAPLVWVYPFDEYNSIKNPAEIFNEDMFVGEAIQSGLPLNQVVSSKNFLKLINEKDFYNKILKSILIIPASFDNTDIIKEFAQNGGKVILYGALNTKQAEMLQVELGESLSGKAQINVQNDFGDGFESVSKYSFVYPQYNNGGLREIVSENNENVLATATFGKEKRLVACKNNIGKGKVGFVRSILPSCEELFDDMHFHKGALCETFPTQDLLRSMVGEFGFLVKFISEQKEYIQPQVTVHRHNNAFIYSMHLTDTIGEITLNTECGVPVFTGKDNDVDKIGNHIYGGRTWRGECRLLVKQEEKSKITGSILFQEFPEYALYDKRVYTGLKNATVRFYPPKNYENKIEFVVLDKPNNWKALEAPLMPYRFEDTIYGKCCVLDNVTGCLYVMPLK